jgi:hypothetical protein
MELKNYAMLDAEGVIINAVVAQKDDFETLERVKKMENADSYKEIDPELINVQVGKIYWNGTYWDKITDK